jgi:hypothetical protein
MAKDEALRGDQCDLYCRSNRPQLVLEENQISEMGLDPVMMGKVRDIF